MFHAVLQSEWPLAVALLLVCGAIATLLRLLSPAIKLRPTTFVLRLHRSERGSVQSLSFVLTVPVFIMLLLLATAVAVLETRVAKLRLFRVPELLSVSFVLALLAVSSSYLAR